MPRAKRPKPIYQRGSYRLVRRADRANLEIIWYDAARKRERSASAGTADDGEGRTALDRLYLASAEGRHICPTCGQSTAGVEAQTAACAIADYLVEAEDKPSIQAIRARLDHVLDYLEETDASIRINAIDAAWIARFRKWMQSRPIISPNGKQRERTLSTVENSVLQFAAAINASYRREGKKDIANFRPIPAKKVNRTPEYRADVPTLARMMAYAIKPKKKREQLATFLRASIATWARPDAVHEISCDPKHRQWNSEHRVLNLNRHGRPQTKKFRPAVPIARQFAPHLDNAKGNIIPASSVRSAWDSMAEELRLPKGGEAGMKLIRRSMADLARKRLPVEAWGEIEIMLGHDRFDDVSGLYAPFRPDYLRRVLKVTEEIIDEIETLAPGAFYRNDTADGGNVHSIRSAAK